MADGVQVVFSGLFLFKITAPFGIKRARTTYFIVSCRLCLCKPIKDSANKLDPPDQLVGLIAFYLLILHLLAIQYGMER